MRARLALIAFVAGSITLGLACHGSLDTFDATLTLAVTGTGDGLVTVRTQNRHYDSTFSFMGCRKTSGWCTESTDLDGYGEVTVTITAKADPDSTFVSWSGSCTPSSSSPTEATLRMNEEVEFTCTARFDLDAGSASSCNNPFIISSTFDTDGDWERNEFGSGVSGSNPSSGGNDGGYRLGGLNRPVNGFGSFALHALHHTGYDPATQGAITAIEYSEDRIVHAPVLSGEGIKGGLYLYDGFGGSAALAGDESVLFTGTSWTTVSVRVEPTILPHADQPFRVGYSREVDVVAGTGTLEHGIDNVVIKICR